MNATGEKQRRQRHRRRLEDIVSGYDENERRKIEEALELLFFCLIQGGLSTLIKPLLFHFLMGNCLGNLVGTLRKRYQYYLNRHNFYFNNECRFRLRSDSLSSYYGDTANSMRVPTDNISDDFEVLLGSVLILLSTFLTCYVFISV